MCYEAHFKPGEVLLKKNEEVKTFYIVISGCIYVEGFGFDEMYIDGMHLYEGNSVGQLAIINHVSCYMNITAVNSTTCKCMKSEDLLKYCEKYPSIVDVLSYLLLLLIFINIQPLLEVQNMLLSKHKLEKQTITLRERPSLKSSILVQQSPSTYSSTEIWINDFLILQELSSGSHNKVYIYCFKKYRRY